MEIGPPGEIPQLQAAPFDLRHEFKGIEPPALIKVEGGLIASHLWQKMIDETKQDGLERGVIVSTRNNKILTSSVFKEDTTNGVQGEINAPLLPHGIRSLLPGTQNMAFIHTHPMPQDMDHVKTSLFSGTDIDGFKIPLFRTLLMLDGRGVHMLLRKKQNHTPTVVGKTLVDTSFEEAKKRGEYHSETVRKIMAERLTSYGIYYYYTPDLTPASDNSIVFKNARLL